MPQRVVIACWRANDLPLIGPWLVRRLLPFARRATRDWGEPVQRLRARLGLPRAADPIFEGQFSPHGTLALYSRVLAQPQPDWPPKVTTTGTAFYNESAPLEPKLEDFLAAGEPPVVFTLGTSAVGAAGRFYHESAAAAAQLGVRAVLLTGGFAQNRPDNARRVRKLGVARTLFPNDYRAQRVTRELGALLNEPRYRERAAAVSNVVREERGAEAAVAVIERLLA